MKVFIIVSTYNWSEALRLCLLSILNQSRLPDMIVIADDGSTNETRELVNYFMEKNIVPIKHVWQEDKGFRLTKIRNKAIAECNQADYVIQIDGDLILHKHFIKDHIRFAKKGSFVSGSRVALNRELSEELMKTQSIDISVVKKGTRNFFNGLYIPILTPVFENYRQDDIYYIRGCNMAFWKNDLFSINGYNEDMTGWGREDNEIAYRLINSGVKKRIIKFTAIVYHIYHNERSRSNLNINDTILHNTINNKLKFCSNGLIKK